MSVILSTASSQHYSLKQTFAKHLSVLVVMHVKTEKEQNNEGCEIIYQMEFSP
jgi:hypothetical protein